MPRWLAAEVRGAGLSPHDLLLELTESAEVRDTALLRRALHRLALGGFGVMLDDLGLDDGRSGLLALPFAGVKLDRKLVQAMPESRRARAEVERIVQFARRRNMVVIAEGVTDSRTWRAVAAAGCDLAQGFGVGRPLPPPAVPAWMSAWRAAGRG
jgi:EAL domain-containing protein (putative c-di-GMP-specific phosphodiesterase class I)